MESKILAEETSKPDCRTSYYNEEKEHAIDRIVDEEEDLNTWYDEKGLLPRREPEETIALDERLKRKGNCNRISQQPRKRCNHEIRK